MRQAGAATPVRQEAPALWGVITLVMAARAPAGSVRIAPRRDERRLLGRGGGHSYVVPIAHHLGSRQVIVEILQQRTDLLADPWVSCVSTNMSPFPIPNNQKKGLAIAAKSVQFHPHRRYDL